MLSNRYLRLLKAEVVLHLLGIGVLCTSTLPVAYAGGREFTVSVKVVAQPQVQLGAEAAAVYDSKNERELIYGGKDSSRKEAIPLLRELNLASRVWTILKVDGPIPTATVKPAMVYDSKRDSLFLFGGWAQDAEKPSADLWTLPLSEEGGRRWKLLSEGEQSAPARNGCVMVLDADRDRLLIHGGDGGPHPQYGFTPLKDLWVFSPKDSSWSQLKPSGDIPEPRWCHAGATDNEKGRMFIFGGAGYVGDRLVCDDAVYELDMATLVWKKHVGRRVRPVPVEDSSLTYDAKADVLVLVGGLSIAETGDPGSKSVWVFDLQNHAWTEHPDLFKEMRRGHTAIYDSQRKKHVISGGIEARQRGNFYAGGRSVDNIAVISVVPK